MSTAALAFPASFPTLVLPLAGRDWRIGAAVLVSVLIHGIALGWLPGLADPLSALPRPLQIRLSLPPAEPAPVAVPPTPTFLPAARASRREANVQPRQATPLLAAAAHEAAQETPAVRVRGAEAAVASPSDPVRPNPMPTLPRSAAVDAGMLAAYGRELAGAVATRQRYPRIALLRQWQGTAVLQLELAADGRLLAVRVLSSSGHESLDRQALEMVREAVPLPPLPATLAGRPLTVDVPVVFRITS